MTLNKDKALFWLNRRIKELEALSAAPNQEAMADAKLSYADRQNLTKIRADKAEGYAGELASLRELVVFVNERA